ncbi:hypothetical protein ACWCP6_05415 [Streptomyces sp. NPDC002004]
MIAHHLLPAAMRELPPPWNDLTRERDRKLEELPRTEANERTALDGLTAALSASPSAARGAWSEGERDVVDRVRGEVGHRLVQALPTTERFTREGVVEVLRAWAETADPPVPGRWFEEQLDEIAAEVASRAVSSWARDVLRWLGQEPRDRARIAEVAERCVEAGLATSEALNLLHDLGVPHGESALLRLVGAGVMDEFHHAWARDRLRSLRRPFYDRRAQSSARGEEPLLPAPVRELPDAWGSGWSEDVPETEENIACARSVLEACLPAEPVPDPVPAPDWHGFDDEEEPAWLEVRIVMRSLMPYARLVTRERMLEALRECALLGIPDVPQDPDSEDGERFVRRWVTWIGGWIAGEVFTWLGMYVDEGEPLVPWAMELAEQYARCGVAAEQAVLLLRWWNTVPRSREALARLAADATLPPEVRESAENGL